MRTLLAALLVAVAAPAIAQDIDQETIDRVTAIVVEGNGEPAAIVVTGVHKSLARNGMGYCGEVVVEEGGDAAVFHVLLETAGGPSVLLASDYPDSDQSQNAQIVRQLLKNFGCTD